MIIFFAIICATMFCCGATYGQAHEKAKQADIELKRLEANRKEKLRMEEEEMDVA